jgi:aminodeoxyfutalosine synthase
MSTWLDAFAPAPELRPIAEKVIAGERLGFEDGLALFTTYDLHTLGRLANLVRERRHGDKTYFNQNFHLNATNVCEASCLFCSFARLEEGMPGAYTMTLNQALTKVEELCTPQTTEVHIVNGLHPGLDFAYYLDLLKASSGSGRSCTSKVLRPSRSITSPTNTP